MPRRIYVETCVILALLRREAGRIETVEPIFDAAGDEKPQLELWTSTVSIVEVARVADDFPVSLADLERIKVFWSSKIVGMIDVDPTVAELARDLLHDRQASANTNVEKFNRRKRICDSLHLASAISAGCEEFWTYEESDFAKYGTARIVICSPYSYQLGLGLPAPDEGGRLSN